jgi:hypothetical protein
VIFLLIWILCGVIGNIIFRNGMGKKDVSLSDVALLLFFIFTGFLGLMIAMLYFGEDIYIWRKKK